MADDKHYVMGDYYRICDRTGFKVRAGRTQKQWDNLIVRNESFELRQPQDFVQGVRDDQTVWEPRPRSIDVYIGPLETTISQNSPAGVNVVYLTVSTRFLPNDQINIMLDTGQMQLVNVVNIQAPGIIMISPPLSYSTTAGNIVVNLTANTVPTPYP